MDCNECGKTVDPLELFQENRCLDCHAGNAQVQADLRAITATDLARMWGAK
jgi:predicted nucleic acid-binding Zn ribbon protein